MARSKYDHLAAPGSPGRGFTLIEVLVALAILTIVLGALVKGLSQNARNAVYLRDRTIAHWIAANTVAEFQLSPHWPALGTEQGETEMAGQMWYWTARIVATEDSELRRIHVEVRLGDAQAPLLETLVSYVGKPFG
ncbi:MAG: general secretion pathway protein I [Candidatus Kentron sp. G]|nr:MAG: general secretion pathway protein I [Candidatus Kentron sp. G]VFM98812.1 MAG: general secretion pathway protein I [Candidatus Kentron sp. G]VFM98931.1 MAG: general secretion pathway protein I [Candidatus Kentron sp. G]